MDNWKIIMSSSSAAPFDVYLVKSYLESEGIATLLQNDLAAQVYSGAVDDAKLLVKENDLERGIQILTRGGYIKD
ncbi:MAG: DUF2007 domain-containing protein [Chitinophagaceae bacterium]|nr:DUF2007 domain-containing protein [Chitinophagaceae bacterium]